MYVILTEVPSPQQWLAARIFDHIQLYATLHYERESFNWTYM